MCSNEPMVVQCPTERGRCVQDHSITASCVPVSVNVTTAYGNHEHVAATATVVLAAPTETLVADDAQ